MHMRNRRDFSVFLKQLGVAPCTAVALPQIDVAVEISHHRIDAALASEWAGIVQRYQLVFARYAPNKTHGTVGSDNSGFTEDIECQLGFDFRLLDKVSRCGAEVALYSGHDRSP